MLCLCIFLSIRCLVYSFCVSKRKSRFTDGKLGLFLSDLSIRKWKTLTKVLPITKLHKKGKLGIK